MTARLSCYPLAGQAENILAADKVEEYNAAPGPSVREISSLNLSQQ